MNFQGAQPVPPYNPPEHGKGRTSEPDPPREVPIEATAFARGMGKAPAALSLHNDSPDEGCAQWAHIY